ncbi:MAG TPA: DUF1801 domain-containing protein [Bacteroidia bacterium]|nr:DUF1801 domain-containing protein [Bacteroidia bacterium]
MKLKKEIKKIRPQVAAPKKKIANIDEYIAQFPEDVRSSLEKLRNAIRKAAPGAEEVISYNMPGFKFYGMLSWFAAYKNHIGFYPKPKTIIDFRHKLEAYEISKGTIRFPLNKPVPVKLVAEIIKHRVKENLQKAGLKKTGGSK